MLIFPSLLVSLLKPSFWSKFVQTLSSYEEEQEERTVDVNPSAMRLKSHQESILVMVVLFLVVVFVMHHSANSVVALGSLLLH